MQTITIPAQQAKTYDTLYLLNLQVSTDPATPDNDFVVSATTGLMCLADRSIWPASIRTTQKTHAEVLALAATNPAVLAVLQNLAQAAFALAGLGTEP